jgi:hypothetical protein
MCFGDDDQIGTVQLATCNAALADDDTRAISGCKCRCPRGASQATLHAKTMCLQQTPLPPDYLKILSHLLGAIHICDSPSFPWSANDSQDTCRHEFTVKAKRPFPSIYPSLCDLLYVARSSPQCWRTSDVCG